MKPVLVLQHLHNDGPAYLATWLQRHGVPFEVRNAEAGDSYPAHVGDHAALAVLGGEMSANDELPALRQAELLILDAMARGRPVIGHCLGGQLMARALGAAVGPSPAPEVGWHPISLQPHALTREWFGATGQLTVFQWHEEAFALPAGATLLAGSAGCPHQAFAIGPHLGMQFHIEVDEEKVRRWAQTASPAYRTLQLRHATVHDEARLCQDLGVHLRAHQAVADHVYARWLASVRDFAG